MGILSQRLARAQAHLDKAQALLDIADQQIAGERPGSAAQATSRAHAEATTALAGVLWALGCHVADEDGA